MSIQQPTTDEATPPDHGNRVVILAWYKSPAILASGAVAIAGALLPFLHDPWKTYDEMFLAAMAALGITAARAVAISAGNQASNRQPGDDGPRADGIGISIGSRRQRER